MEKVNIPTNEFEISMKTVNEDMRKKRDTVAKEIIDILIKNKCTINDTLCINNRIKMWLDKFRNDVNEKTPLQYDQREEENYSSKSTG